VYRQAKRWPNDEWSDKLLKSTTETRAYARDMIDRLVSTGHLKRSNIDIFENGA
jgi:hypothetical protein